MYKTPKKNLVIHLRLSEEDYTELERKTDHLKMDPSDYLRLAIRDPGKIDADINWNNFKKIFLEKENVNHK